MTTPPAIPPAMPPEEWAAQLALTPKERRKHLLWAKDEADQDGWLTIHGLAALCLYGQPFGFTQEGVRELRAIDDRLGKEWGGHPHPFSDFLASHIARIAALLPPPTP